MTGGGFVETMRRHWSRLLASRQEAREARRVEAKRRRKQEAKTARKAQRRHARQVEVVAAGWSPDSLRPGMILADRYMVGKRLGAGGMGIVFRGADQRHPGKDKSCAIKVMKPELLRSESALELFIQEARVTLELQHENIVRVYDARILAKRYPFIVMELLEGVSLRAMLKSGEGRLASAAIRSIAWGVLRGLDHAHSRTVHRDIKPENVFIVGDMRNPRAKLLDFGIAKSLDPEFMRATHQAMGTIAYVAPEQILAPHTVGPPADLYSVGVLMYEMLVGAVPTGRSPRPSEARVDVTRDWDEVVSAALDPDPRKRFVSARAMADAVKRLPVEFVAYRCPRCKLSIWQYRAACPSCGLQLVDTE